MRGGADGMEGGGGGGGAELVGITFLYTYTKRKNGGSVNVC